MTIVRLLESLAGPARRPEEVEIDKVDARSGPRGQFVRRWPVASSAVLGAVLLAIALLPLDGFTKPDDDAPPLLLRQGDAERLPSDLRVCVDEMGQFAPDCRALGSIANRSRSWQQ